MSQTLDTLVDQIAHHAAPPRGTVVREFYTDERGDLWVVFVEPDGFTNEQPLACCTVEHGQYVGLPVYREDLD